MPPARLARACCRSSFDPLRTLSSQPRIASKIRVSRLQSRSYSLAPPFRPHGQNAFASSRTSRLTPAARRPPLASPGLLQHRLQSSLADSSAAAATAGPAAADDSAIGLLEPSSNIPVDDRHVGFLLDNYGIDFGWGTSTIMKCMFEVIHCDLGTEFWASILLTGLALRLLCTPLNRAASDTTARMSAVASLTKPIQAKMSEAVARKDQVEMQRYRAQISAILKEAGVKPWKIAYSFVQIPVGFGCWRTFANMAAAHVDGMSTGGVLWFTNLTVPDPFFVLPVITCLTQYLSMRYTTESSAMLSPAQASMQKIFIYGLPCLFFPIVIWAPAAIQLHFLTTASFSGLMNLTFRSDRARSLLRMSPRVRPSSPASPSASQRTINISATSRASPATSSSQASPPDTPPTSIVARFRSSIANARESVMTSVSEALPASSPLKDRKKSAAASKASAYETRRAKELEQARLSYEQQLRAYRMDGKRTRQ